MVDTSIEPVGLVENRRTVLAHLAKSFPKPSPKEDGPNCWCADLLASIISLVAKKQEGRLVGEDFPCMSGSKTPGGNLNQSLSSEREEES